MVPMRACTRYLSLLQRSHARVRGLASATFFGLLLVGLLAGYGNGGNSSGGGSTPNPSAGGANEVLISGRAAKGTVLNATVRATQIINGQLSGTQQEVALGPNGDFAVSMPKGLVHLQVIPQENSTTQDEAIGVAVPLPLDFKFRAAADLTDTTATIVSLNITPFSEACVGLALTNGGLSAANINRANNGIAEILGVNHLATKPINANAPEISTATPDEKRLSVLNAAVSNMAATDVLGCGAKDVYGQSINCTVSKLPQQFQIQTAGSTPPTVSVNPVLTQKFYQAADEVRSKFSALKDTVVEIKNEVVASAISGATFLKYLGEASVETVKGADLTWNDYKSQIKGKDWINLAQAGKDFYQYAQLSELVYQDYWASEVSPPRSTSGITDSIHEKIEGDWQMLDWYRPEFKSHLRPSLAGINTTLGIGWDTGLEFNVLVSPSRRMIVFAYRGTETALEWGTSFDVLNDSVLYLCPTGISPPQYSRALTHFEELAPLIRKS